MKTKIAIEGTDIGVTFIPETDLERMVLSELGDHISVSRSHQNLVLRKRQQGNSVRRITDAAVAGDE